MKERMKVGERVSIVGLEPCTERELVTLSSPPKGQIEMFWHVWLQIQATSLIPEPLVLLAADRGLP